MNNKRKMKKKRSIAVADKHSYVLFLLGGSTQDSAAKLLSTQNRAEPLDLK
jgi:hypothetical protein